MPMRYKTAVMACLRRASAHRAGATAGQLPLPAFTYSRSGTGPEVPLADSVMLLWNHHRVRLFQA
jgi:hypothetical protein